MNEREYSLSGERLSLLAVFAHPEDEAFGSAGTLAKYAAEGIQVSLITALRERSVSSLFSIPLTVKEGEGQDDARDVVCSCRTTGVRRICLMDNKPVELDDMVLPILEDRLVRVIREVRPQVIVTYGHVGFADPDHQRVSELTMRAFRAAGDAHAFVQHFREGLTPFAPQKLYYAVLPNSLLECWGVTDTMGAPDDQITTVLDVSSYGESKRRALYCQRNHMLDYARWLTEEKQADWNQEYFLLAFSNLARKVKRERDLFFGLR